MKNFAEPFLSYPGSIIRRTATGAFVLLLATGLLFAAPQDTSAWKHYRNSEYGFEIAYPAGWEFGASDQDKYGKPPLGNRPPAYAGETRTLFDLEMDGPDQSHQGGGYFEDGAIITVRITGTSGRVEDWSITPGRPWYLVHSTPSDWVKLHSSSFSGDGVQKVAVNTNGFTGAIEVACNGSSPCKLFGEEGGAWRPLADGRVLLVSWERMTGGNDFSYQKYFLHMLSSFKLLK